LRTGPARRARGGVAIPPATRRRATLALLAVLPFLAGACGRPSAPAPRSLSRGDDSRTSLDWSGTYTGVVPCADCEGIETTITLRADHAYTITTKYLGKDDPGSTLDGTFAWNEAGSEIALRELSNAPSRYLVGENALIQLDLSGERITGELASRYILRKTSETPPVTPEALTAAVHWNLIELGGQLVTPAPGTTPPTVMFSREGARISGFAGCNRFMGRCEFQAGNRLRFSQVAATKMACLDMTLETGFLQVLNTADSYNLAGRVLTLSRAHMAPLARLEGVYAE
jgi:heat shock protein HslJ